MSQTALHFGDASTGGKMLTGLFRSREAAERAYRAVEVRGYTREDVNVLMSDRARALYYPGPEGALAGAGIGTAVGSALGALVAAVSAIGTNLVLPGIGLVIAGPLAAGFAGAGAGGLAGGSSGRSSARAFRRSARANTKPAFARAGSCSASSRATMRTLRGSRRSGRAPELSSFTADRASQATP